MRELPASHFAELTACYAAEAKTVTGYQLSEENGLPKLHVNWEWTANLNGHAKC